MAIVVDKLLTVLGFKTDSSQLQRYRAEGRRVRHEVGNLLSRAAGVGQNAMAKAGAVGSKAFGALAVAGGVVTAAIGAGTLVMGSFASIISGAVSSAVSTATGLMSRLAGVTERFLGATLKANVEAENLATRLETLKGTGATKVIKDLERFAAETPFQLNDITNAFVRLDGLGFDVGSDEVRRQLGDVAAASGKTFTDLAEIMSSANRGSANMLDNLIGVAATVKNGKFTVSAKRFGIDERTFNVGDQEALLKFLTDLGKAKGISGGMEKLSRTLGGLLSTAQDRIGAFYKAVGAGGFNAAVKELLTTFNALSNTKGPADLARSIGAALGKVVGFLSKTLKVFDLERATKTLEVFFGKLGLGFDELAGEDGPKKLAELLELPFRLLDDIMLLLEGRAAETGIKRFFDQFKDQNGAMGRLARQVLKLVDHFTELVTAGEGAEPGLLDDIIAFGQHDAAVFLGEILRVINMILDNREDLASMLKLAVRLTSAMTELVGQINELGDSGVLKNLRDLAFKVPGGVAEKAVEGADRGAEALSPGEGGGAPPAVESLKNLARFVSETLRGVGNPGAFAASVGRGGKGAAGAAPMTNTTTNATTTNSTVNVGTIQVGSPSDVGGAVGSLAAATG